MARTIDPVLQAKWRTAYKVRCALANKCKRCPKQNDNPTSLICVDCTQQQRLARVRRQRRGQCIHCQDMRDPSSRQLCTRHLCQARHRTRERRAA